jgi:hemolysin D
MLTAVTPQAAARSALAAQAHDFAPDLLTVQLSPPSRLPRAILLGLTALVGCLLIWSFLAELDIVATAQGRLVPISYTKVVQPAEAGVVSEILVKDGDAVKAGQVLLRLDARLSQNDLQAQGQDVAIKRMTLARIAAELAGVDAPNQKAPTFAQQAVTGSPAVAAQMQAQFQARRQAYQDALAQELQSLEKARAERSAGEQVYSKLKQTLPSYAQTAQAYETLQKEGFVGEVAANEKRRDWVEKSQDLKAQESTLASLQASIAQSEKKLVSLRSSYQSQLENERVETQTQLAKSAQELEKSSIRSGLLEVRAPTDGVVKDLAVTSKNAVVQAGALLMNIVPQSEALQAEVLLANEDVGFVAAGQKAQVKIAAFPFTKYGLMQGSVTHVGADASDPKQNNSPQAAALTYRALVKLDSQQLTGYSGSATLALNAGMAVVVEIHQGKRTVMEYLLSPVLKVRAEAARER